MRAVLTPEEMRGLEKQSFETGISSREVMGRAGAAAAEILLQRLRPEEPVLVVCGGGNNGGDGFVCAYTLAQKGRQTDIMMVSDPEKLSSDAAYYYQKAQYLCTQNTDKAYAWAVDALFGIGFHGCARGKAAEAILFINELRNKGAGVLAIDIPSGLHPESGMTVGPVVQADLTVTFQYSKTGQILGRGLDLCGELLTVPVGLLAMESATILQPEWQDLQGLFPPRKKATHKGSYGHIGILAGSRGMEGAGALAALAALRSGAGRVSLGVPESCLPFYDKRALEIMCTGLPDKDGRLVPDGPALDAFTADKDAVVIGPGLGRSSEIAQAVRYVLQNIKVPLIIDADGLFGLTEEDLLFMRGRQVILTPHTGELAHLLGVSIQELENAPLEFDRGLAEKIQNILVHKSAYTVIATPGKTYLGAFGSPGMATAGSGDVLAGILGALAAVLPFEQAAWAGAMLHGAAGALAAAQWSETAMIASDIIACLPAVFCKLNG